MHIYFICHFLFLVHHVYYIVYGTLVDEAKIFPPLKIMYHVGPCSVALREKKNGDTLYITEQMSFLLLLRSLARNLLGILRVTSWLFGNNRGGGKIWRKNVRMPREEQIEHGLGELKRYGKMFLI